jgi:hypothetical protein
MTKHKLFKFLTTRKGYLDWGSERIQQRFAEDLRVEEIDEVKDEVKDALRGRKKTAYEQFLEEEGLREEEVDSYKVWDTENGRNVSVQVKYDNKDSIDDLCDVFKDKLGDIATPEIPKPKEREEISYDVLGVHDAHIDKVVLTEETDRNSDASIEENVAEFEEHVLSLIEKSFNDGTHTLMFPVGSDFWTVNDDRNTTKRGTKQRVLVPFQRSFKIGVEILIRLIRYAAERFPKVIVPVVYGNHDEDLDFFLSVVLEQVFQNVDHVEIHGDKLERKYFQLGNNGIMLAHGYHCKTKSKLERLPANFSQDTEESSRIWYETRDGIRKAFLGDIHHEEQYQFLGGLDTVGLNVQFMRSVGNTGKYEWDNGWTGVPKTAYLWRFFESGDKENMFKEQWR